MDPTQTAVLDGRYELIEMVGAGGAAEVWRALDSRLGRDVAVKILSGPAARDPEHRRRIEREARALAAVVHPNVVSVFDYGEQDTASTDPVPYIVLELVDGPDLARRLSEDGPMSPSDAVSLMEGVLAGVQQVHQLGIVHGDLKPANVFLAADGPKVGDFGVARILAEETGTTAVATTPAYAAPEVLRGERPTAAADVYAAGGIAFETVCGRPPFDGRNYWELFRQHTEETPPAAGALRPGVPPELSDAISRALAKDPADRPATAAAFAAELRAAIEAPAVPAPVPVDPAPAPPVAEPPPPEVSATSAPTVRVSRDPTEALPRRPSRRRLGVPLALKRIPPGLAVAVAAVMVLVGQATARTVVPSVTGMPAERAVRILDEAGFDARRSDVPGPGVAGTVMSQTPPGGARLAPGDAVRLTVSQGVPQVVVPDVVGRTTDEAVSVLEQAGLTPDPSYVPRSDVPPLTVVETTPAAGARVDHGTKIDLDIALAPQGTERSQQVSEDDGDEGGDRGRGNGRKKKD